MGAQKIPWWATSSCQVKMLSPGPSYLLQVSHWAQCHSAIRPGSARTQMYLAVMRSEGSRLSWCQARSWTRVACVYTDTRADVTWSQSPPCQNHTTRCDLKHLRNTSLDGHSRKKMPTRSHELHRNYFNYLQKRVIKYSTDESFKSDSHHPREKQEIH